MTRETKIGMLVGLAFIIVIGILLSDHMTSTTEPAKAALSGARSEVMSGVTTPAPAASGNPAVAVQIPPTAPNSPVPTQDELNSRSALPPVQSIAVGPGAGANQPPQQIIIQQSNPLPQQPIPGATGTGPIVRTGFGNDQPTEIAANGPSADEELKRWATKPPTEAAAGGQDHPAAPAGASNQRNASPTGREYTVEPGDTLSKLAGRFLGGNTKANRDAIVDANPSLKKDPNRLIVGKVYIIPGGAGSKPAAASTGTASNSNNKPGRARTPADVFAEATTPVKPAGTAPAAAPSTPDAGRGLVWYTVNEGDNLWKIAAEQLGSGNEWQKIKDINKDVLKGGETVHPNMRLRLPQKGIASAN